MRSERGEHFFGRIRRVVIHDQQLPLKSIRNRKTRDLLKRFFEQRASIPSTNGNCDPHFEFQFGVDCLGGFDFNAYAAGALTIE